MPTEATINLGGQTFRVRSIVNDRDCHLLREEVSKAVGRNPPNVDTLKRWTEEHIRTVPGMALFVWLHLRHQHPQTTREDIRKLVNEDNYLDLLFDLDSQIYSAGRK